MNAKTLLKRLSVKRVILLCLLIPILYFAHRYLITTPTRCDTGIGYETDIPDMDFRDAAIHILEWDMQHRYGRTRKLDDKYGSTTVREVKSSINSPGGVHVGRWRAGFLEYNFGFMEVVTVTICMSQRNCGDSHKSFHFDTCGNLMDSDTSYPAANSPVINTRNYRDIFK